MTQTNRITSIMLVGVVALAAAFILVMVLDDTASGPSRPQDPLVEAVRSFFWAVAVAYMGFGAIVGYHAGKPEGHEKLGFVLGGLFSLIGWVLVMFLADSRPTCPECKGVIIEGSRRCKNCGVELAGSDSSTSDEEANQAPERRSRELF